MTDQNKTFDEAWDEAFAESPEAKQEEPAVEPEVEEKPEPAQAEVTENEVTTEEPQTEETDYQALYLKEVQRNKSWEGRIRKSNQEAEEAKAELARLREEVQQLRAAAKSGGSPVEDPPEMGDETLDRFVAEFPDLHAPLQALVRKEAQALVSKELGEIKPTLQQVRESEEQRKADAEAEALARHFKAIDAKHPDRRKLIADGVLEKWIASKPTIFRPALEQVVAQGTADEVIELFDQLKADLGLTSPHPTQSGDKRDKLKAMVAVPGRSAGIPKRAPVADDFDSAWEEATKTR